MSSAALSPSLFRARPPSLLLRPFPSIRHNSLPEFVDRVVVRVDVDLGRSIPRGSGNAQWPVSTQFFFDRVSGLLDLSRCVASSFAVLRGW